MLNKVGSTTEKW